MNIEGKKYNLKNDYSNYDIVIETFNNNKIFIEVKSTKSKFGNTILYKPETNRNYGKDKTTW